MAFFIIIMLLLQISSSSKGHFRRVDLSCDLLHVLLDSFCMSHVSRLSPHQFTGLRSAAHSIVSMESHLLIFKSYIRARL